MTLDSKTQKLSRSGMYYAFAHYSKAVKRGASVIGSNGSTPGVEHVAFANPDGSYVLVLTNAGDAKDVSCGFQGKKLEAHLPADSVTTLRWS